MECVSCNRCLVCGGKGPAPQFSYDYETGVATPLPFTPCVGCGLDWPTEASSPPSSLLGPSRLLAQSPQEWQALYEIPFILA